MGRLGIEVGGGEVVCLVGGGAGMYKVLSAMWVSFLLMCSCVLIDDSAVSCFKDIYNGP